MTGIERRYVRARRIERALRRRGSLADEALLVVLEWGPPMRLPEAWRLEQRCPEASPAERSAALDEARTVMRVAYDLMTPAWPRDRPEDPAEVDRVSRQAHDSLIHTYPRLDVGSLKRAVNQANYTHYK